MSNLTDLSLFQRVKQFLKLKVLKYELTHSKVDFYSIISLVNKYLKDDYKVVFDSGNMVRFFKDDKLDKVLYLYFKF